MAQLANSISKMETQGKLPSQTEKIQDTLPVQLLSEVVKTTNVLVLQPKKKKKWKKLKWKRTQGKRLPPEKKSLCRLK